MSLAGPHLRGVPAICLLELGRQAAGQVQTGEGDQLAVAFQVGALIRVSISILLHAVSTKQFVLISQVM